MPPNTWGPSDLVFGPGVPPTPTLTVTPNNLPLTGGAYVVSGIASVTNEGTVAPDGAVLTLTVDGVDDPVMMTIPAGGSWSFSRTSPAHAAGTVKVSVRSA